MNNTANSAIPKNDDTGKRNVSLHIVHKRPSAEKVEQHKFKDDAWALLEKHGDLLQKYFSHDKQCMEELRELCLAHGYFNVNHDLWKGGMS